MIVLRDIYDMPHGSIAAELGISEAAAKVRLHRARRRLRDLLVARPGGTDRRCRGLAEIVRLRTADCRQAAVLLPSVAAGEADVDERVAEHVATCLRCQAEVAAYRRILRHLRSLRQDEVETPPGAMAAVLDALAAVGADATPGGVRPGGAHGVRRGDHRGDGGGGGGRRPGVDEPAPAGVGGGGLRRTRDRCDRCDRCTGRGSGHGRGWPVEPVRASWTLLPALRGGTIRQRKRGLRSVTPSLSCAPVWMGVNYDRESPDCGRRTHSLSYRPRSAGTRDTLWGSRLWWRRGAWPPHPASSP